MAEAAYAAIEHDDLEAFVALLADDLEFTPLVAEAEGTTDRGHSGGREWWRTVRATIEDGRRRLLDREESGRLSRS